MKEGQFKWILEDIDTCMEVYRMFNWGQNYERLIEACDALKINLASLTKTSNTRFTNSKRFIFINFMKDLPAIVSCLENACMSAEQAIASARERKK